MRKHEHDFNGSDDEDVGGKKNLLIIHIFLTLNIY